jgi:hypothetical protein
MKTRICIILLAAAVLGSGAGAQRLTEQFIPIGKSPGVSGVRSLIGKIERYDAESRALTLATSSGKQTLTLTDKTRIWLDRSKQQRSGVKGEATDLQTGRTVEVHYADVERKTGAEWIKVEAAQ